MKRAVFAILVVVVCAVVVTWLWQQSPQPPDWAIAEHEVFLPPPPTVLDVQKHIRPNEPREHQFKAMPDLPLVPRPIDIEKYTRDREQLEREIAAIREARDQRDEKYTRDRERLERESAALRESTDRYLRELSKKPNKAERTTPYRWMNPEIEYKLRFIYPNPSIDYK